MLLFFCGKDNFSLKEAVQKKTASFLRANPQALVDKFNLADQEKLNELIAVIETRSFFNEKRLLIVNDIFSTPKISEKLVYLIEKYINSSNRDIDFIFCELGSVTELEKKDKDFFRFLAKKSDETKELPILKGAALEKLVLEKIQNGGLKIKTATLKKLLLFTSYSPEKTANEIEKLIAYKSFSPKNETKPDSKNIEEKDIENIITPDIQINNFLLIDAVANREKIKAITTLAQRLAEGEDPQAVLGLLAYQFRILLKVKSLVKKAIPYNNLAKLTALHPFVVKKTFDQVKKFEIEELKSFFNRLAYLDLGSKNGKLDLSSGIYQFFLTI